jgi:RNA polymerase sigma-70 factor (ECF subfamily)
LAVRENLALATVLCRAHVQILDWENKMIGFQASEPQTFAEPANDSERDRSEMTELPEREVIRRAQLGDAAAFECIYRLHSARVYALCSRMLGNRTEAEDLTQEAFLGVLRKIRTFRGEAAFSTWLHRIAVNLVLMRLRKKTWLETSPEKTSEPDVNLQRAMDQLAPSHKMVVELHDIQGYKHKEIAQIMDCSIGNSKAQLHRARRRLRDLLRDTLRLEWRTPPHAFRAQLSEG